MFNLIALSDGRIRGEDGNKFDYKKGAKTSVKSWETMRFYTLNGWKLLEDKDVSNAESAKEAKEVAIQKARAKKK